MVLKKIIRVDTNYIVNNITKDFRNYLTHENVLYSFFILFMVDVIIFLRTYDFYKKTNKNLWKKAIIFFYKDTTLNQGCIKKSFFLHYTAILINVLTFIIAFKNLKYYIFDNLQYLEQIKYFYLILDLTIFWIVYYLIRVYINKNILKSFRRYLSRPILFLILTFNLYITY